MQDSQCPLDAGSSSFYETASSLREYSSLPRPSDPLPYSTSGRNPPHGDNVPVTPLPQARTASLYEAQMSREMHLFSSSVSPVPHPATPLSERHYSLPLPLWRIGTPSQPVHKLEHPMYPASTFPFPLPLYHKHFEPPSSPAPAFLPSLAPGESYTAVPPLSLPNECYAVDQLEEEATTSFWTRGPPPPPALLSKEHLVDGRRRYAAQLEREAAELVAPLAQQVDEPGWGVNPERAGVGAEENSRAAGWLEMGSEEDKRHHATREGAPLLSPAPPAVVPRRASLDSHRSTPRSIAQASMFDLSRPPYPPSSSQLTGPRALSSPTPSSQAAPAEQSLPPAAVTPGERNSTSRPPSQAPSLTARAGGANPTTGAGTARGAGSCPHREGVEHEESGDKVQSDAEGSELGAQRWDVLAGGQELRAAAVKAAAALREKAAEAEAGLEGLEEFEIWEDEDEIEEV
ncbi:hypothetical protein Rhopal_004145-T1 [Rhodotorula paludigena]|uniref:Uncharacterized protein n=1 Tax=Rhodotorula paludigena TaxID=86838 RepID=A0AAV5GNQ3_9BASI|nr:hypothetical protein Rhopal_004145-T1 [Rhodotorula paludigena]